MSKWIKRGDFETVRDFVTHNTNMTEDELINPKDNYFILGIKETADFIVNAIMSGIKITIYGDYDADGVTGTVILYRLLTHLGAKNIAVRFPRRFSEGYGLSEAIVDEISEGLLLLIDNGISAVDAVKKAKEKGLSVIILDHHLLREDGILPDADHIINPSAILGSDFSSYCGAGIAYKLATFMTNDSRVLSQLSCLAAIGTIADVMPLIDDNRSIVLKGLNNINEGNSVIGLKVLLRMLSIQHCTEEDISFKIAPIINASGRMLDDGAKIGAQLLAVESETLAEKLAKRLLQLNELRKSTVEDNINVCKNLINEQCLYGDFPLVVYTTADMPEQLHEGVMGILAGKLSEEFKCPAFVFAENECGVLKGSGRSYGDIHLKAILDDVSDNLIEYGGHAGAAGLKLSKEKISAFKNAIQDRMKEMAINDTVGDTDVIFYDLEIDGNSVDAILNDVRKYAPYGEGNPKPHFAIRNAQILPSGGKFYRIMGDKGQHIKLTSHDYDIIGFDMSELYRQVGEPMNMDVIGTLSENIYMNRSKPQIIAADIKNRDAERKKSSLAGALNELMKNNGF